jgi:hypothetical protein
MLHSTIIRAIAWMLFAALVVVFCVIFKPRTDPIVADPPLPPRNEAQRDVDDQRRG